MTEKMILNLYSYKETRLTNIWPKGFPIHSTVSPEHLSTPASSLTGTLNTAIMPPLLAQGSADSKQSASV